MAKSKYCCLVLSLSIWGCVLTNQQAQLTTKTEVSRATPRPSIDTSTVIEKERIAVLGLKNRAGVKQGELNYLSEVLRGVASQLPSQKYSVMTEDNILVMLPPNTKIEDCQDTCAITTGRNIGAHWVLVGSVVRFGKSLRIMIRLHHTATGDVRGSKRVKGNTLEDLEQPLEQAAFELFSKIYPSIKKTGYGDPPKSPPVINGNPPKSEFDVEVARLKAQQVQKKAHLATVNAEWQVIQASRAPHKERIALINQFIKKYQGHSLGNPKEIDALRLKRTIEKQVDQEKQELLNLEHTRRVKLKWEQVKPLIQAGDEQGQRALTLFLQEYQNHPLGNPFATAAQETFKNGKKTRLEAHRSVVAEAWKESLSLIGKGGPADIKLVNLFIRRYANHPLGNHLEQDAYRTLAEFKMGGLKGNHQPSSPSKIPVENSPSKGSNYALVTIVKFSDFQCPFCKRVTGVLKKIHQAYGNKVRLVYKHNPLPFHKDAPLAAQASYAAHQQGKFWEMHDKIFEKNRALKRADLERHAQALGLDMAKFKADIDSFAAKAQIKADQALAAKLGARGTPHFFVNGKRMPGALPFDRFKSTIDAEIKAVTALMQTGKTAAQSYKERVTKNYADPAPRKKRATPDKKTVYNIQPGTSYAKGGTEPLVTIIEFGEFQCPFCSRALPTIKKVHETYGNDVKVVFKHNPLAFHKDAEPASKAALAAGEQGKFWEMHDLLFANQRKLKAENLNAYAIQLGLDLVRFKADMANPKFDAVIKADQALGAKFGARGTPNFFINGRNLRGAQPFASFKKVIDEEITKAKALITKGIPRVAVYKARTAKGKTKAAAAAAPRKRQEDNQVYKVDLKVGDAIKGNLNAPVTIVEFADFQCPFCSRVNSTLEKILETYGDKVRLVFKHNPLAFHKDAHLAAEAALAAGAQGRFWEMHDALFANQRRLKRLDLEKYAAQIGLDVAKFNADLDRHRFRAKVDADLAQAKSIGVRGTPNFFINGKKLTGARPFASFKDEIDQALRNTTR